MKRLFKNRVVYLSVSFLLLLASFPLISIGTTKGPTYLWWLGLVALLVGAMIPPAQRLFFPPKEKSE
ncbi:hypothetical protein [Qingshengfaniella alkalisoli]|uniref:Uncharacterized protein n=1 Tax=Qingshengfaniella alkalisoli TaxID=2599296 RepID=A0A5B8J7B4_9RHOB|nr:hypothetical protein [Qingshengfaniella alkalisoli]QDY70367.1 hypothetical protein FPZ52_11585 [Qingshengfaniella alkalisoli]